MTARQIEKGPRIGPLFEVNRIFPGFTGRDAFVPDERVVTRHQRRIPPLSGLPDMFRVFVRFAVLRNSFFEPDRLILDRRMVMLLGLVLSGYQKGTSGVIGNEEMLLHPPSLERFPREPDLMVLRPCRAPREASGLPGTLQAGADAPDPLAASPGVPGYA